MRAIVSFLLIVISCSVHAETTVRLIHFSDYHSHAHPFYSEGRAEQGGLARTLGYLKREKKRGALVFNGGDMMNKGAPAWSDKFGCVEWSWLNGVVDAMAFGNHDADYGWQAFVRCRSQVRYPILSANIDGFQKSAVFTVKGLRIGVIAVAGSDLPQLVRVPEIRFSDRLSAVRELVSELRERERVNAVVLIGHEHAQDDFALARAIPGIDLIFGSHGHRREELTRIEGTNTWFVSPFQYLAYLSEVDLKFDRGKLTAVSGRLVRVDRSLPIDRPTARKVARLQQELERDPQYVQLFVPFTRLAAPMSVEELASLTVETMRRAVDADAALSTASSFRQPLPPGALDMEGLRAALPYDNEIVVAEMPLETYQRMRAAGAVRAGTDNFVHLAERSGGPGGPLVRVATTDYMARVSSDYRGFFAGLELTGSGVRVRDEVRQALTTGSQ